MTERARMPHQHNIHSVVVGTRSHFDFKVYNLRNIFLMSVAAIDNDSSHASGQSKLKTLCFQTVNESLF